MSRVFWDTMLFVYLLEGHEVYAPLVQSLLLRSHERGDTLLTSYLAMAEIMAGKNLENADEGSLFSTVEGMGFRFVAFDRKCVGPFRQLRSKFRLRAPDAMHIACAAATETDLFLTGDRELLDKKLHVAGVHFLADFEDAPL